MMKFERQAMTLLVGAAVALPGLCAGEISPAPDSDILTAGTKAPNFTRTTTAGQKLSLKRFRGKKTVILYFYPKDESIGCTKEACGFRDFANGSKDSGAEIIGVSGDSDDSHKAFAIHYSLPFDLIADSDNSLLKLFHVPLFKGTMHQRVTFVIDKRGYITKVIHDTNDGDAHVREATVVLQSLEKN